MDLFNYNLLFYLGSYILGSIPFGYVLCKIFCNIDIRKVGSKNIGATNVLRTSGKILALLTFLLDAGKGAIAIIIVSYFNNSAEILAWSGLFAILGHNYSLFLKFNGGKGVSTTLGVLLFLNSTIGIIVIVSMILAMFIWRYSSLAALISIPLSPILSFLFNQNNLIIPFIVISFILFIREKENIKRLLNGTEPKIGKKN